MIGASGDRKNGPRGGRGIVVASDFRVMEISGAKGLEEVGRWLHGAGNAPGKALGWR